MSTSGERPARETRPAERRPRGGAFTVSRVKNAFWRAEARPASRLD